MLDRRVTNQSFLPRVVRESGEPFADLGDNLTSWYREIPVGLAAHLVPWAKCFPAEFSEVVSLQKYDLSAATRGLTEAEQRWLMEDFATLLSRFSEIADTDRIRVSFGAVRTDQCRKFHVDYVRYRLITTYVGPGTEWLPDEAVCREVLKAPPECPKDANQKIVRDAAAIRYAKSGEILVMKGALHLNSNGVVHRSPPIEGSGQIRIVLSMSTVNDR